MDMMYLILVGGMSMLGMVVSGRLKKKFQHYSQIPLNSGLSGREVAMAMLRHYGINDVNIVQGKGMLTDHYNPMTKTVSLSPQVYQGRSVSSAAVAAHEVGHAVQHNRSYVWLKFRSALVPLVNMASKAQQWLFILAFGVYSSGGGGTLMYITVAAFAITAFFAFVTLPVEFDASRRALAWLDESGFTSGSEHEGAKDALWWAAMTYVSAALSALVMVLYLLMRMSGSRRR